MAQPSYALKYLGAIAVEAGQTYTTASILTQFPTATCVKLKQIIVTNGYVDDGKPVAVSIDGTAMFEIDYDEESYLETGHTYTFNKDCVVAVGTYVVVT